MSVVLQVEGLCTSFKTRRGLLPAVHNVDLRIEAGETLALVGESGSGKSVTALSILRLISPDHAQIKARSLRIGDEELCSATPPMMRAVRGKKAGMIFQDPATSLNPVLSIGRQIVEALEVHAVARGKAAWDHAQALLERVRVPDAGRRLHDFPHQLSGGMNQRVMIALAIACSPRLLIADEPTTALDVTIQAQILRLIRELQDEIGMGVLLITHDLAVVARNADRVAVMYAGRKVEEGRVADVLRTPLHPYTAGLLAATPDERSNGRLAEIPGLVPGLAEMPPGCPFAPRCTRALDVCSGAMPTISGSSGRLAACFNPIAPC